MFKSESPILRRYLRNIPFIFLTLFFLNACQQQSEENADLITTIKPVTLLASQIAGDHLNIVQLIPDGSSPHHYALRPSDLRQLTQSPLITLIDPQLETFLAKPLASIRDKGSSQTIVTLTEIEGVSLRRYEEYEQGEETTDHHDDHDDSDTHHDEDGDKHHLHAGEYDLHIWLNPENAIVISQKLASMMSDHDPAHADIYQQNAEKLIQQIKHTDKELQQMLATIKETPYLVFHDAWGYFQDYYHLSRAIAIQDLPGQPSGAARIRQLHKTIQEEDIECLFSEPQLDSALIIKLSSDQALRIGTLDPLGMTLSGEQANYANFLREIGQNLAGCLKNDRAHKSK